MKTGIRPRLRRKMDQLNEELLSLGALVENSLHLAVKALEESNPNLAATVIEGDQNIDRMEVDLEEDCLEILALHQPVAGDLRHIISVLKINKDLERAGDLATNIAEIALRLSEDTPIEIDPDYFVMARKTQSMLRRSLDAFVNSSVDAAYQILSEDDQVDQMKHAFHNQFTSEFCDNMALIKPRTNLFLVSRHLERIADLATNIAEEVIYIVTGEIIRHGRKDATRDPAAKKYRKMIPPEPIRGDETVQ